MRLALCDERCPGGSILDLSGEVAAPDSRFLRGDKARLGYTRDMM